MKGMMPIFGTTIMDVPRVAWRLHRVPDFILADGLDKDMNFLAGPGWYALVLRMAGGGRFAGDGPHTPQPPVEVLDRMLEVGKKLNAELHHNGHWIVGWHQAHRLFLAWRDDDGALQFDVEFPEAWERLRTWTVDDIVKKGEQGWAAWAEANQIIDAKPEQQTIKPTPSGGGLLSFS